MPDFSVDPLKGPYTPPGIQGQGKTVMWATWPQVVLAVVVIMLRCVFSGTNKGRWRWDCCWAVVALAILTLACIDGFGQHIWDLGGFAQASFALKWYWISASLCFWALTIAKIAIVSLLFSVWCPWQTKRKVFLHSIWISNTVLSIVQTALTLNQCHPIQMIWDYSVVTGECNLRLAALYWGYLHGAWSGMTDIALALYPILIMKDIKADLKTKIGLCILMSGGLLSAIASFLRAYYLYRITLSLDTTFELLGICICGSTELWLIVVLSSIPPLKHFFLRLLRRSDGSPSGTAVPLGSTAPEVLERKESQLPPSPDDMLLRDMSAEEHAMVDHTYSGKKNWMGGITMRSSVWMTSRPATRPSTRPSTRPQTRSGDPQMGPTP
ncbi:Histone deacetylase HOS3 [Sphaceloma murrayae]|uniref:Histone deacetylase HOS3 n=1 Tax=Sphaceloma murrayae TaxID=2082308 RepID=A0A2K1R2B3_9PEZI|nr:Histone deacetylase HOS3 [Sphaceloma murrayae]